jgi:hypothetical protein
MRRRFPLLLLVLLAGLLGPAAAGAAAAPKRPVLPADLQALLARGAHLNVPYAIIQTANTINGGTGFQSNVSTTQVRLSPPELASSSGAARERLVGGALYLELPGVAAVAHGRHWIRATPAQLGVTASQLLGAADSVPGHASQGLNKSAAVRALLADASSVREVGPSALGSEPVTEFLAGISFGKLLGLPISQGPFADTVYVQLYFGADGLLRRLTVNIDEAITETTELLTDAVPVVVHRPPAHDVVPYSRALLRRLVDSLAASLGNAPTPHTVPFDVTAWLAHAGPPAGPFGPLGAAFAG